MRPHSLDLGIHRARTAQDDVDVVAPTPRKPDGRLLHEEAREAAAALILTLDAGCRVFTGG